MYRVTIKYVEKLLVEASQEKDNSRVLDLMKQLDTLKGHQESATSTLKCCHRKRSLHSMTQNVAYASTLWNRSTNPRFKV